MNTKIKYFLLGFLFASVIVAGLGFIVWYKEEYSDPRKYMLFYNPVILKAPLDLSKIRLLNGDSLRLDADDIVIIQAWRQDHGKVLTMNNEKLDSLSHAMSNVKVIALNVIDSLSQQVQYAQQYATKNTSSKISFAKVEPKDAIFQLLKKNELLSEFYILDSRGNYLTHSPMIADWNNPEFMAQLRSLKKTQ